ncbi:hypothetical protein QSJ18_03895 [Gordonia sp. ABSL1-1]|uniref:YncE family protein n=1 Tax=Gordonia sp. ABSL1-1 TaxID=3053923 RepID=UPI002573A5C0|nr:hypothetical protein [Gordonia sp. ABSL1-1]MDL9935880.1 hypothetical protein [Gordonia sp. ABSL1-1]
MRALSPLRPVHRFHKRGLRTVGVAALTTALAVAVVGCSSSDDSRPDVPTVTPATASPAPAGPAAAPAGQVVAVPRGARALAQSGPTVAVLGTAGTEVLRLPTASLARGDGAHSTVRTPALLDLIPAGDGSFVGVGPSILVAIDANGQVRSAPTTITEPTALARTADGRVVVGTAGGRVVVYDKDFRQLHDFGGFVGVDELTVGLPGTDGEQVVVLDRAQSSVTPIDLDNGDLGPALRAGNGATNATADHFGRVLVANTRDGEILGFFGSPMIMRFRYPVAGGPFAVDYDDTHELLWVSTTGNNKVVAYALASGEPRRVREFATVAQPDHLVVDDTSGALYVLSSRDGQLQTIPTGAPLGTGAGGPGA